MSDVVTQPYESSVRIDVVHLPTADKFILLSRIWEEFKDYNAWMTLDNQLIWMDRIPDHASLDLRSVQKRRWQIQSVVNSAKHFLERPEGYPAAVETS
jgi:hypothetical protein